MARAELDLIVDNALQMYEELKVDRAKMMDILRNKDRKDWEDYLEDWKENTASIYKGMPGFSVAMDALNIISPRFYAHGVDITDAMREALYIKEETDGNEDWEMFLEALSIYEQDCVKMYASAVRGVEQKDSVAYTNYRNYLEVARKVNEYVGENVEGDFYETNTRKFRDLVEELMTARSKCVALINFEPRVIPDEMKGFLKKGITYEQTQEIVEAVRENIGKSTLSKWSFSDDDYKVEDILDSVFDTALPFERKRGSTRQILKRSFVINYLEDCGVGRKILTQYRNNVHYQPYKKAALALGMFSEPYSNYEDDDAENEIAIKEHIETFMNQNGQSICSKFSTISEYDDLMDNDIVVNLEDGVPEDCIAFMMKYFGKTKRKVD